MSCILHPYNKVTSNHPHTRMPPSEQPHIMTHAKRAAAQTCARHWKWHGSVRRSRHPRANLCTHKLHPTTQLHGVNTLRRPYIHRTPQTQRCHELLTCGQHPHECTTAREAIQAHGHSPDAHLATMSAKHTRFCLKLEGQGLTVCHTRSSTNRTSMCGPRSKNTMVREWGDCECGRP